MPRCRIHCYNIHLIFASYVIVGSGRTCQSVFWWNLLEIIWALNYFEMWIPISQILRNRTCTDVKTFLIWHPIRVFTQCSYWHMPGGLFGSLETGILEILTVTIVMRCLRDLCTFSIFCSHQVCSSLFFIVHVIHVNRGSLRLGPSQWLSG